MAAKALVTPAKMIEMTIAGPAPTWPESPLIAVPIAAKMPAPIMAPMPRAVSWTGPRERRRPPPTDPSAMHWSTVFRANSWLLSTGFLSRGVLGQLLRVDGHRCDVIDVPSITGRRRVEQVSHHPFRKLAAVARVPDGRSHLDAGDSTFGGNPEPDLVASAPGFTRCARRRKNRPPRRGGENITRIATRASAGIGSVAGTAIVGTVTAGACGMSCACAADVAGNANQLTAGRPPPPPPPPPRGPEPPPPSNNAAPRHSTRIAMVRCATNDSAAAGPSRRRGSGSA